eukprot:6203638-Pleurochrysis_carterae.AAC.1
MHAPGSDWTEMPFTVDNARNMASQGATNHPLKSASMWWTTQQPVDDEKWSKNHTRSRRAESRVI